MAELPLETQAILLRVLEEKAVGKTVLDVAPDAMERLKEYPWPGNVRQLRNVVERGINMTTSSVLRLEDLPFDLRNRKTGPGLSPGGPDALFGKTPPPRAGKDSAEEHNPPLNYTEWERRKSWELMQKYRGNKSRIAEELGISRCTLYKKLRRYAF